MQIATFVGHDSLTSQVEVLTDSIIRSGLNCTLTVLTPKDCSFEIEIPSVIIEKIPILVEHRLFPFYDKLQAAAFFERTRKAPFLWVDIDSLFLEQVDFTQKDIGLRVNPVDHRNVGVPVGYELTPMWYRLMELTDLCEENYKRYTVYTSVSEEKIYAYFNMGMVYVNTERKLFQKATDYMTKVLNDVEIQKHLSQAYVNRIFLHQMIFSICVCQIFTEQERSILPQGCNLPLHLLAGHVEEKKLMHAKSIRYDNFFAKNKVPEFMKEWLGEERPDLTLRWFYE